MKAAISPPFLVISSILLALTAHYVHPQNIPPANLEVKSETDWFLTSMNLTLSREIELPGGNLSPSSHPKALRSLERELPNVLQGELTNLPWNHLGNLGYLAITNPQTLKTMEALVNSVQRQWSRLSLDGKVIEAQYNLDISTLLKARKKNINDSLLPPKPLGWTPTPRDPWTGLIIYVPPAVPIHGEDRKTTLTRVVYPRILSEDMEVLANISPDGDFVIPYLTLRERNKSQEIVGSAPYRTMAKSLKNFCDIIINREDTRKLLASPSGRKLLVEGRIVILLETSP